MPASGSGSFECAVFPSSLLSQSHKNRIRQGKKKPPCPPLTPVYFPCIFRKRMTLLFYAKASHQDLMFYYMTSYFTTTNPWSYPVTAFKDSIPFWWWNTLLTNLINTPELEVHQCYWKYLSELSFKQSYPSLIQMLLSISDKKSLQVNLHCSHHQSE